VIDGGHDAFHDNPLGLKKCLAKVLKRKSKGSGGLQHSETSIVQFEILSNSRLAASEINLTHI